MRKLKHQEISRLSVREYHGSSKHPVSVLIDNIRSAHNVGSIMRTSDAARIEHVYVTGISPDPSHRLVHKTALGAQDSVSWSRIDSPLDLIADRRKSGYTIAALELTDKPTPIESLDKDAFPLLLIVGNELSGVSDDIIEVADLSLEIPQYGTKQSLNVSVAYGIAVFGIVSALHGSE